MPAVTNSYSPLIESQGRAIDSLHRQVERLKLERVHLLIELGQAWEAILNAKVDPDEVTYVRGQEYCNCNPCEPP